MWRRKVTKTIEDSYPTSGMKATPEFRIRAGFQYGTPETGIIRFGRDPNGQAWLVVDKPRRGSKSGRSVHITEEVARDMRDILDALLGQPA
jgi:hypothetical protein